MGWVVSAKPRPLYPGKDPLPIVYEDGWTPQPVWMVVENLAPTGIRLRYSSSHRNEMITRRIYRGVNVTGV